MNPLIAIAGSLYRGINRLRRALYRAGILRGRKLPRPVISIGNIAAGGAGKTPAVIALCRYLEGRGRRVAVLTRGHGRVGAEQGLVTALDPLRFGDEPVLIKKSAPYVDVIVGANRYDNAVGINTDIFILDDGFQHLQLERDLDVVIDVPDAEFYREGRSALQDADIIISRNVRLHIPDTLRGRRLFAFAGLADNKQFFRSLTDAGLTLAGTLTFRDHHRYTPHDLDRIAAAAKDAGAELIVTTEKDAVKIDRHDMIPIAAHFVLPDELLERVAALLS
ncbi:MAG: tetraacyldisaccharide 4'-kinase [Thermoanaerobaculia bacterium]